MLLHFEVVQSPDTTPRAAVAFLHGILGQGTNLRTLAKRVASHHAELAVVLLDLRAHGASLGSDGQADSLESAADDVVHTVRTVGLPVESVVGHSFGGKVAMLLANRLQGLQHLVILDSTPAPRTDFRGSELTLQVLAALENAPPSFVSREAFVEYLAGQGIERPLGQWLAMNLIRAETAWQFGLEIPRIRALLDSYFSVDAWPSLERAVRGTGPRVHFIIGERSKVFDVADRQRAGALTAEPAHRCTVDVLPTGHWVHVEDFEGTVRLINQRLG